MRRTLSAIVFAVTVTATTGSLAGADPSAAAPIDRKALVERHNVTFTEVNPAEVPQVGNGEIAFGIDVTGLQTLYGNAFSQWAWHSTLPPVKNPVEAFKMFEVEVHGHTATYPVSAKGQKELYGWLRENPHRLNLGKLAFVLDGKPVQKKQLSEIRQTLDLWRGVITSTYKLDGVPVTVVTTCHPKLDMLAVEARSPLIKASRLAVQIAFPYGHPTRRDGADWNAADRHSTDLVLNDRHAVFKRKLDNDRYEVFLGWDTEAALRKVTRHIYELRLAGDSESFSLACLFAPSSVDKPKVGFKHALAAAAAHWERFWKTGGAIDLSGSKDPRWKELERRVVLSQYLLAVNEAGSLPPQESGLVNNSGWYGKFHLEMHWWHGAHYQLWNRWALFDRSLGWYRDTLPVARRIAKRQGYRGGRWPKMVGPDGRFGPSTVGPWLIWQQPHPIFYAEQNYRLDPSRKTLEKWKDVVFETAEFMASYAHRNEGTGKYELGPWVINAAENNGAVKQATLNPAFELAYWRYGLSVACQWRERMGLPEKPEWEKVLSNLAPLPVEDGVYVMWEGVPNMWTKYNRSHIDVIGAGAFLPNAGVDLGILGRTVDKAFKQWNMASTWGWDFPWLSPRIIPSLLWHKDLRQVAIGALFCYRGHMNTVLNLFRDLWNSIGCIGELLGYLLRFVRVFFRSRASLAARLLAAESQLVMCKRRIEQKQHPKPRFSRGFRILWVVLSKLWAPWRTAAQLMQPATVKAWHTRAFKLYWRWKSRKKPGRPPITREMQELIRKLSRENPLWGAEVIRLTLLKLQYDPPWEDTIRKYMVKPRNPRGKSSTWLPFLRNHMDVSWAIDFFTVTTIRFATLYAFIILAHSRRKVVHWAITPSPSMRWVIQQLREAMPYGQQPRFLFRDNDGIYGGGVREFLDSCGIEELRTAYRSPWQNPLVERFGGTLRRELLDHVIVLGQGHLERLLREFIEDYYHVARPHQGLDGDTPIPQPQADAPITSPTKLISTPIVGGLHHRYQRVAA